MTDQRVPRTTASTLDQLKWQLDFLRSSIERYDSGNEHEAMRIATVLRVLLHSKERHPNDKRSNPSVGLLKQLRHIDTDPATDWTFLETAHRQPDGRCTMPWGFLVTHMHPKRGTTRLAAPVGGTGYESWDSFPQWWNASLIGSFSRSGMVRDVADTDGGAHVDQALAEKYNALRFGEFMNMPSRTSTLDWVVRTPIWEVLRQIGYEVQATVHKHLPDQDSPSERPEYPDNEPYIVLGLMRARAIPADPDQQVDESGLIPLIAPPVDT